MPQNIPESARATPATSPDEIPSIDSAAHIQRMVQTLANSDPAFAASLDRRPDTTRPHAARLIQRRSNWTSRIAMAVATASVAIAVLVWQYPWTAHQPINQPQRIYATNPGERLTITLDDGTVVSLNVASTLAIGADYGKGTRTVQLDGEAQFVVTHDANRPFRVEAQGTIIRDLATTFAVRAYPGKDTRVAVSDGRVSVQSPMVTGQGAVTLDPGHSALVTKQGTVVSTVPDASAFAWTDGRLIVRAEPLGEVLPDLQRWYGMEFRVADDALLSKPVSATLPATFSQAMLEVLADVVGARLEVHDGVVTFVPKHTQTIHSSETMR